MTNYFRGYCFVSAMQRITDCSSRYVYPPKQNDSYGDDPAPNHQHHLAFVAEMRHIRPPQIGFIFPTSPKHTSALQIKCLVYAELNLSNVINVNIITLRGRVNYRLHL